MGASHHSQDPGYLAGCHLSPPILDDYVSAFIQTEGKNVENRLITLHSFGLHLKESDTHVDFTNIIKKNNNKMKLYFRIIASIKALIYLAQKL